MALRFKTIGPAENGYARADVGAGCLIHRQVAWRRDVGWFYTFWCDCGWAGEASAYNPKSNDVAEKHATIHHKETER
jgi:hypothetical protein